MIFGGNIGKVLTFTSDHSRISRYSRKAFLFLLKLIQIYF